MNKYLSILLAVALVIGMIYTAPPLVHAQQNYILIELEETEGISRYNYTVPIHIDLVNFPDYYLINESSIAFLYDNTTPCYFWVQSISTLPGSVDMLVYVKVPYIPAYGTADIYMYYGVYNYTQYNDPYKVFKFFVDFSNTTILNSAQIYLHDTTNDYVTITNGTLVVHAAGDTIYGAATVQFPLNVSLQDSEIIFSSYWQYSGLTYPVALIFISDGTTLVSGTNTFPNDGYGFAPFSYNTAIYKFNNTITSLVRSGQSVANGVDQVVYFTRQGSRLLGKGTSTPTLEAYDSQYTNLTYLGFLVWCSDTGTGNYISLYVRWIAVRDYIAADPQVVIYYTTGTGTTVTVSQNTTGTLNVNLNVVPFANKTYPAIYNLYTDIGIITAIIVVIAAAVYVGLLRDRNKLGIVMMLVIIIITAMVAMTRSFVLTGEYYINNSVHYIYKYNPVFPIYNVLLVIEFAFLLMLIFDPYLKRGRRRAFRVVY